MESANIHHQDQLVGSTSSSSSSSSSTSYVCLTTPSVYGVGATTTSWIPNSILNTNGLSLYGQVPRQQHQENLFPNSTYMNFNMPPDLGFIQAPGSFSNHSEMKEEQEFSSENYYLKFTDMLNSSPSSSITQDEIIRRNIDDQTSDIRTKMLLNSSRIFPSVNVPTSYQHELGNSHIPSGGGSFDMNLQALDLLAASRFGGNLLNSSSSSQNQIGAFGDGISSYGFNDHMRQTDQIPSFTANTISQYAPSSQGSTEAKRKVDQPKQQPQSNAPKKPRNETRTACPPFKVRKEKLGDRIAALQQLVAPFGKTDTASVLMEAIGYIKFLQDQVETLSVPYMKTSRNKAPRSHHNGIAPEDDNHDQMKRDLKTRGLCLVPLSCLSYISDGGGSAVWPLPNFGGPT